MELFLSKKNSKPSVNGHSNDKDFFSLVLQECKAWRADLLLGVSTLCSILEGRKLRKVEGVFSVF